MPRWLILLLRSLLRWLQKQYNRQNPPNGPMPPTCPITWQPSALAPVFWGVRDYGRPDGAPGPCLVYFPSLDGAVLSAPILEGCGRYPLILFAHGYCERGGHYEGWGYLAAQLARSGYVVVRPEIPSIATHPSENDGALLYLAEMVSWMREEWEHRSVLLPPPATGVAGHSYGALLGARFAAEDSVSAYASIAGVWEDTWVGPRPIEELSIPMFFCWGPADWFTRVDDPLWSTLALPKHKAIFAGAHHWDYLRPGASPCEQERGPCTLTQMLTWELVTSFFGKYLSPEFWPSLGSQIPDNLIPPEVILTEEQEFFAGSFYNGFRLIESSMECQVTLTWETASTSGTLTRS